MKNILLISLLTAIITVGCSETVDESELELQIVEQTVPKLISDLIQNTPIEAIDGEKIGDYIKRIESDTSLNSNGSTICLSNFLFVLEEVESFKRGKDDELLNFLSAERNSEKKIETGTVIQKDNGILDCDNQPQSHESIGTLSYSRILFSKDYKKARFLIIMDYGFARNRFIVQVKNVAPPEAKTSEFKWEIEKIISI